MPTEDKLLIIIIVIDQLTISNGFIIILNYLQI